MQHKNSWLIPTGVALVVLVLASALILPGIANAQGPNPWGGGQNSCDQVGSGWSSVIMNRVMDMFGGSNCGGWSGNMMGGMMGSGMMNGFNNQQSGPRLALEEAHDIAERYAESYNVPDRLAVKEVMEFSNNFYAEVVEADTGIGAFEILIDPISGNVNPEPGPNMMWNTKYGMHRGTGGMMGGIMGGMMSGNRGFGDSSGEMTVTPEQAIIQAQRYLNQSMPGLTIGDEVDSFYGYYTLHTLHDGEIEGMLSVSGSSGRVWYHNWHGDFIDMAGDTHN